jgi:protein-S-isoprenylcysteine O-methyltransferase Ste14
MNGPKLKKTFNPLKTTLSLLIIILISNIFYKPLYELSYYINIFGCFLVFVSILLFISAENEFMKFREDANPPTGTKRILDKNIYSFVRNPIYLSFIILHLSFFFMVENILFLISSIILTLWLHFYVVLKEEEYLIKKFKNNYKKYCSKVPRWLFF